MRTEPYDNQDGRKCWLSRDEVELLLEKAREAGTREEIALSLGARCGLRASEIVGVKPVNLDSHDIVGARIEVTEEVSKTNLPREVPISPRLRSLIQGYAGDSEPSEPIVDVTTRTVERWVNRAAAEIAEERGGRRILDEDVEASFERARKRIRSSNLDSLTLHHHILYSLIYEGGRVKADELHEMYEGLDEDVYYGYNTTSIGKRSRRNKLSKLREYDLIGQEGPAQNRVYFVLDESIEPPVDVREEVHA